MANGTCGYCKAYAYICYLYSCKVLCKHYNIECPLLCYYKLTAALLVSAEDREWTKKLTYSYRSIKVKSMQRPETEAIRTQIKLKLQIVKIQREHMVNRVSSYFQKGGYSATPTELNNNMNTRNVKRHRNSDTINATQI